MTNSKMPKNAEKYICEECNFKCSKNSNFKQHLLTAKHKMLINANEKNPKNAAPITEYKCVCEKIFKHASSLCKHKKKCGLIKQENETIINQENETIINQDDESIINQDEDVVVHKEKSKEEDADDIGYKEMFLEMMKQNHELQKSINEMIPKIGNNNTTGSHNTNNNFNIQLFLNEECKNALNMTDFVRSLEVNMNDLVQTGKLGYVEGISRIFVKALRNMDVTERPIHCTDIKRETMYIKDDNKWEKETEVNPTIQKTILKIENKNIRMLPRWQEENPDSLDMESKKSEEFTELSLTAMGGFDEKEKLEKKILKNILKEVIIKTKK